jgi:transcriptional regulator NrdR family protein
MLYEKVLAEVKVLIAAGRLGQSELEELATRDRVEAIRYTRLMRDRHETWALDCHNLGNEVMENHSTVRATAYARLLSLLEAP